MEVIRKNVNSLSEQLLRSKKPSSRPLSLLPENVGVMVVSKVVPSKKLLRVQLPHCVPDLSVCFLVKDTDKTDYNKSVDAWKLRWKTDCMKRHSSTLSVPTFIPLRELKLAYQPFASKQRLAATFDLFLADRRIVHHLPSKLGKAFYGCGRGKIPVPVTLTTCNVVDVLEKERNTMLFQIRGLGSTECASVGDLRLSLSQLKDNILTVCERICKDWPGGGLCNVRSIYIQCPGGNIPLYFDATELPLDTIVAESSQLVKTKELNSPSGKQYTKQLTMDLLSRVAEDLPLPTGGLEEILAKAKRARKLKRLGQAGKVRKPRKA
ncbi:hypothetical protein CRM22_005011 [Opisthorchis felineus]|uniref:Ribosomal protein L1 n=1 Tax=Opisthorchis felineus TaxID=147828 RepID=A0A4S2LTA8_OPIFE|nr:hypothetical protein CRM22_005011 [Opisthorchis felineus]